MLLFEAHDEAVFWGSRGTGRRQCYMLSPCCIHVTFSYQGLGRRWLRGLMVLGWPWMQLSVSSGLEYNSCLLWLLYQRVKCHLLLLLLLPARWLTLLGDYTVPPRLLLQAAGTLNMHPHFAWPGGEFLKAPLHHSTSMWVTVKLGWVICLGSPDL